MVQSRKRFPGDDSIGEANTPTFRDAAVVYYLAIASAKKKKKVEKNLFAKEVNTIQRMKIASIEAKRQFCFVYVCFQIFMRLTTPQVKRKW